MTPKEQLKKHQKYYHAAWAEIAEELKKLLPENGFTLKGAAIGNVHGEVYAYADEATNDASSLYLMMIAPTQTGKLKIKLTFDDGRQQSAFADKLKATQSATKLGSPEKNQDGRYEVTYYFIDVTPPAKPEDASAILLERTTTWLKWIKAS